MARGDTRPPVRTNFDEGIDHEREPDREPARRMRYPCTANNCPMPGSIFEGASSTGVCGWHSREMPGDWPRITETIRGWECVVRPINAARRVLTAEATCADPKAQREAMQVLWTVTKPAVLDNGWLERVQPKPGENLGDWGRRLEKFLGARIKEVLSGQEPGSIDETLPTRAVSDMRGKLRAVPLRPAEDA